MNTSAFALAGALSSVIISRGNQRAYSLLVGIDDMLTVSSSGYNNDIE